MCFPGLHRWSHPAPLGDYGNQWFKICEKCGATKIIAER